ncbi:hypothetical protein BDV23DRAFT_156450 [Aspergillus alliaceus]|uniref:Flavoprotein oxygenase n=1 Tax=Petromyces alliaceus TaxID=209559 RepID=A0A5N7C795_PETAA|nr:hypothetical protein BDV23DRAFT_156450 [Aspergillus alliaceus]
MEERTHPSHLIEFTASLQEQSDLCLYSPTNVQPSTVGTADHPHRSLDHDEAGAAHGDIHALAPDCGYNSSASSTERSSSDFLDRNLDYEELRGVNSRASSRSSISSIPASVLANSIDEAKSAVVRRPYQDMISHPWDEHNDNEHEEMGEQLRLVPTIRKQRNAFRKSSSVRAMQMHTEDEGDGEYLTPPKRRGAHRMSDGPLLTKQSLCYSPTGIVAKQTTKKEYPLVLLHCTLLPPSLPIPGIVGYPDQKILREVLPAEYWKRWKLLEDKIGSVVLRERGVLISHPEDMYDLLEERLLESLELQRPRFDHGHFLGHEGTDADREDQSMAEESATDDEQGEQCPDCGGHVIRHGDTGRKWEIRVFAANGLMRAGAWAAAWKEMEKVDVEVGLWLPSEVRRELEKRLLEDKTPHAVNQLQAPQVQEPVNDIAPKARHNDAFHSRIPSTSTNNTPKLFAAQRVERPSLSSASKMATLNEHLEPARPKYTRSPAAEIELQTLLVNYIRVLASDRRNVAIALLSILVVFLAMNTGHSATTSYLQQFPPDMLETIPRPTVSLMQYSSAVWEKPTGSVQERLETSRVQVAADYSAHHDPSPVPSQLMSSNNNIEYGEASEVDLAKSKMSSYGANPEKTTSSASIRPINPIFQEPQAGPMELSEEVVDPTGKVFRKEASEESTALLVI